MTATFSRSSLLRRGALGGGALLASGTAASVFTQVASAALPDGDLAYLRLLVAIELLQVDFQTQALASGKLSPASTAILKRTLADDKAHYNGLASLQNGTGQTASTADDIDFSYPAKTFDSEASILVQAKTIEALAAGAYLGAVQNVQTASLRLPIGQIAANESQHLAALQSPAGKAWIGSAFAPALQIDTVSAALDEYES